jgi:hypothetical protein
MKRRSCGPHDLWNEIEDAHEQRGVPVPRLWRGFYGLVRLTLRSMAVHS